jgi:hypothetical protein
MERKRMENIWKGKHGKYMDRESTENIWKGKARKIYGKGASIRMITHGLKEGG